MRQSFKVMMGLVAVAAIALPCSNVYAARVVQGTVLDTGPTDPFGARCIEERTWSGVDNDSLNGAGTTNCANTGVGSCTLGFNSVDMICNRSWQLNVQATGRSGYSGFADDKGAYNADSPAQPMYILWENIQNELAANYSPYYYAASQVADDADLGKISDSNCTGTIAVACFFPGTTTRNGGALVNVPGGPRNPIGGLGAIPIPTIQGTPVGNTVNLAWGPVAVFDNGQGAPNPFKHYRVFRWADPVAGGGCGTPLQADAAWTSIGTTVSPSFTDNAMPTGVDCVRYSVKLVFNGPALLNSLGTGPGDLSTRFRSEPSAGISRSPSAVQITNFDAKYAGKGTVNVKWTGLVETGLAGYYLGQSLDSAGPYRRLGALVPVTGDGSNYLVANKVNRKDGVTVWYQLELVATDGSITTMTPISITLPTKQD